MSNYPINAPYWAFLDSRHVEESIPECLKPILFPESYPPKEEATKTIPESAPVIILEPRKVGRPKVVADVESIVEMLKAGLPRKEVARRLGISPRTLRRRLNGV